MHARLALVLSIFLVSPALAQDAKRPQLPINAAAEGTASKSQPAVFVYRAAEAGLLCVTLTGSNPEVDLLLAVCDEDNQPLEDGTSDRDHQSHKGKELVALMLPEPGTYLVQVDSREEAASGFTLSAGFAAAPAFAMPNTDPDRRPTQGTVVTPGKPVEDSLGGGDKWDWFSIRADTEGTLTILTKAQTGDLKIEAFAEGNFREHVARSDQDLQGNKGNESMNLDVKAGQTFYVRVTVISGDEAVPYRLVTAMIPN